jgi:hypothetical protein
MNERVARQLQVPKNGPGHLQPFECNVSFPHPLLVVDFYRATIFIPTL